MRHTDTTTDDSLLMVRAAWQRLRKQYLQLHADQTAGQTVNWSTLAESFLDMNMALEATMVAATRPTPLAD
ncbi:hypothetical protein ASC76_06275 [Rhizobacter sp. Root404]|jgi:hypothetical protein|nr:hypothetical protein ASC76_06275 [Rhizobacter sp. Root404]